jgi:X-Pro dipeptidyl-peptidase
VASSTTPCEKLQHTQRGYDDTPDYDKFWIERDYLRDAAKVAIPVLVMSNWGDWNVKQEESYNWFKALKNSEKASLYMGSRYKGHQSIGGDSDKVVRAWFDHYLMGIDNGIDKLAKVTSEMANYDGATKWYEGGIPKTRNVELFAQERPRTNAEDWQWKLLPSKPIQGFLDGEAKFPSTNINSESHANHHARSHPNWFWFESPHLKKDTRIFGEIKVKHYSTVYRKWVTLTPTIVDVDPGCHEIIAGTHNTKPECLVEPRPLRSVQSITRGFLDTRYRDSLAKQKMLTPGQPFSATVVTKPQDYTFKKGHYIGLQIQTEIIDWAVPKVYPGCDSMDQRCTNFYINWLEGKTSVILPVVNGPRDGSDLFDFTAGHGDH